ncbi:hypothetical protein EYF80_065516 [Liparis tanakae]|uniref:Uncharacterized protein n=1 Tax=Liparis tanakae TaxID=230148 RepID=A0A4Z2E705_9TELE|nr:hypothetical protein EYF80_065516 [Liparis tanakae]
MCVYALASVQKLAVLKDSFRLDSGSQQDLWGSSPSLANSELSIPPLYSDAGSQTDIPAEVSGPGWGISLHHRGVEKPQRGRRQSLERVSTFLFSEQSERVLKVNVLRS